MNIFSETGSINQAGDPFKLSDHIKFAIIDGDKDFSRDEAVKAAEEPAAKATALRAAYQSDSIKLYPEEAVTADKAKEKIVTMVVYMPTTVENEANYAKNATPPVINLGLNLFATQLTSEEDSYGPDYDKDAPWTGGASSAWYNTTDTEFTLMTVEDLAGLAQIVNSGTDTFVGKTVKMGADMDLNNVNWTPIGTDASKFQGTFKGEGKTISNLKAVGTDGVGLFGKTFTGAHIENLNIDGAYVSGEDRVGVILGGGYLAANCITGCTVQNATVIAAPYLMENGTYDGGAKAGVIAGQAYNGNLTNNTVKDATVTAYRDLGAIAGMLGKDGTTHVPEASGNHAENVTLNYIGVLGSYADGKVNENRKEIVGRVGTGVEESGNTHENVVMNDAVIMITTLDQLIAFAKDVNGGNTYKGKTVMLGADIDLCNMEWTPIGNSTNKFQGTFDGNNKTVSNLSITGNSSYVGLFGYTTGGEIKNLTVENAKVSGYLGVGVVAGSPYTSDYTNITVTGHVEVNGMAYVGGVGGRNAYADWTNITVAVDDTSYVKADSVEDGTAYRTYVGGVVGFMGEGSQKVTNVKSNIDVIGSTIDVGGIVGIAYYGNTFENVTCTGDVTITGAAEAADAEELGGIAGVWNNGGADVTFTDCSFTGKLTANITEGVDLSDNTITGAPYSATGTGRLIIDGKCVWPAKDEWDGTVDTSWYNETDTEFELSTAEQLAGLAELVDAGNTFEGKTIKLTGDIDLYKEGADDPISFEPIGCFSANTAFKGTFDGQGNTIFNMYQNGWALENGYWDGPEYGLGLFALVEDATVKNVNFDGVSQPTEANIMGFVAGGAGGNSVFENITVTNSYMGNHSWYSGGIVGWAEGDAKFINCDLDDTNSISSQWGDFNNANGGLIGGIDPEAKILIKDCDVACVIDAYNDVTSAYEWYSYRSCGMLIGDTGQKDPNEAVGHAVAPNVTCENVTVTYGTWANYHYCEFGSARYPFCRVEAGESTGAYGNARVGEYTDANGNKVVDDNHAHNDGEKHNELIVFDQLFGGESGDRYCTYGTATHPGVTVTYNNK